MWTVVVLALAAAGEDPLPGSTAHEVSDVPLTAPRADLLVEYARLDLQRTPLLGPVAVTCAGGTMIGVSVLYNFAVFFGRSRSFDWLPMPPWQQVLSATLLAVAAPALLSWGISLIKQARQQRAGLSDRMGEIEDALSAP